MFRGWDNFYLMSGSAAGALIGLMFVVATLGGGRDRSESLRGVSIFMTPTVVSFTVVLVVSALTAVPHLDPGSAAGALGALAGAGALYAGINAWRLTRRTSPQPPHWTDYWCYGFAPLILYLTLGAAAAAVALGAAWAAQAAASVLMAILLLAIRNAWDLVTWLAPERKTTP